MARDLNHVSIIGRLVRDPEIRYTPSGTPVTKFSIANNVSFTVNNEKKDYVNYFDINVWGNQAVNCEKYLKKGSQVAIVGNIRQNRWDDKNTGQTRSKVEITASSVQFLTPASGASVQGAGNVSENSQRNNVSKNVDMIQDPWNDNGNVGVTNPVNEPYVESASSDDDIPF